MQAILVELLQKRRVLKKGCQRNLATPLPMTIVRWLAILRGLIRERGRATGQPVDMNNGERGEELVGRLERMLDQVNQKLSPLYEVHDTVDEKCVMCSTTPAENMSRDIMAADDVRQDQVLDGKVLFEWKGEALAISQQAMTAIEQFSGGKEGMEKVEVLQVSDENLANEIPKAILLKYKNNRLARSSINNGRGSHFQRGFEKPCIVVHPPGAAVMPVTHRKFDWTPGPTSKRMTTEEAPDLACPTGTLLASAEKTPASANLTGTSVTTVEKTLDPTCFTGASLATAEKTLGPTCFTGSSLATAEIDQTYFTGDSLATMETVGGEGMSA